MEVQKVTKKKLTPMEKVSLKARITQNIKDTGKPLLKDFSRPPTDPKKLIEIADELELFFRNPVNMEFSAFALSKGWNPYRFKKAAEHSEYLTEKMIIAKEMISQRLERNAREGNIDMTFIKEFLPKYSQEYKDQRMEMVSKAIEMNKQNMITVVVPPFPNSDQVPERKEV